MADCSPVGRRKSAERFITGGDDKKLHLWSTRQRAPLLSLRGNTSAIQSVLLDASEELAVAGGAAGAVKLWDLVEGRGEGGEGSMGRGVVRGERDVVEARSGEGGWYQVEVRGEWGGWDQVEARGESEDVGAGGGRGEGGAEWSDSCRLPSIPAIPFPSSPPRAFSLPPQFPSSPHPSRHLLPLIPSPPLLIASLFPLIAASLPPSPPRAPPAIRTMTGHKAAPVALDLYSAGGLCASLSPADGTARVWDPRQKEAAHVFRGMGAGDAGEGGGAVGGGGAEGRGAGAGGGAESVGGKGGKTVGCVRFSPDGRWVVAGGQDGRIKLFDLAQGRLFAQLAGHAGAVAALDFHPQELLLASAARDRTVRWWDLESFNCVDCTPAGAGGTAALAFAPQGDALFAPCVDHLKVWGWEPIRCFDTVHVGWPKVADVSVNDTSLVAVSASVTVVTLWTVDLERVLPFCKDPELCFDEPLPLPSPTSSSPPSPVSPSSPTPLCPLPASAAIQQGSRAPATLPSSRARSSSLPRSLARHLAPTIASLQRARCAPSPSPSPSTCCDGERERERAREREREKEWDDRVSVGTPRRYVRSPQRSNGGVGRGERGDRGSAARCSSEGGWWGDREGKGGRGGVVAAVVLGCDDCNGGGDKRGNYGGYTTGGDTSTDDECTSHRLARGSSASHGATAAVAATAASRRSSHVHSLASPRRSPPSSSPSNPTGHSPAPAASARTAPSSSATPVTVTPSARVPSAAAHPASPARGRANAAAAGAPASAAAATPATPAAAVATQAAAGRGGQGAVSGRSPIVDLVSRVSDWIGSLSSQEQTSAGERRAGGSGGSERRKAERGGSEGRMGERWRGKVEEEVADAGAGAGGGGGATGSAGNGGGSSSFGRLGQTARRMTFGSGGNGGGNNGDGNTHAVAAAAAAAAAAATASRGSGSRPGSGAAVAPASAAAGRAINNTPTNATTNANADANACTHTTSGDHPSIPPYAASLRAPYAADTQPDNSPPPTCSSASASLSVGSWGFRTSSKARGKRQGSPVPALSEGRSGSMPSQSSLVRKLGLFVPRLRPPYAVDDEEVEEGEEVEQGGGGEMAGMVRSQSEKVPGSGPLVIRHGGLADVEVSANQKVAGSGGVTRRVSGEEERRRGQEKGKEGAVGAAETGGGAEGGPAKGLVTGASAESGIMSREGNDWGHGAAAAAGGGVVGRVGEGSMGGLETRAGAGAVPRQVGGGAGDLIPFLREAERQEQLQQTQQAQQQRHHPQQQQQQHGGGQSSEEEAAVIAAVGGGHEAVVRQLAARRQAVRQVGEMWRDGLMADVLAFLAVTADEGVSGGEDERGCSNEFTCLSADLALLCCVCKHSAAQHSRCEAFLFTSLPANAWADALAFLAVTADEGVLVDVVSAMSSQGSSSMAGGGGAGGASSMGGTCGTSAAVQCLGVDGCAALVPILGGLLESTHSSRVHAALLLLRALLRCYSDGISAARSAVHSPGVDLHMEMRLQRCAECAEAFRALTPRLQTLLHIGPKENRSLATQVHMLTSRLTS
ncbi:unnamed protein product [Closterium sp. NIES-64]|nr:unnamed protein product [Closterium sp. NIES-64]